MIDNNKDYLFLEIVRRRPRRVLELGPCHGRDTVALSALGSSVVAVEGRPGNCETVRRRVNSMVPNADVDVILGDLETFDLNGLGRFDLVLATGILYHLKRPWDLVARIQAVTDLCLGWSHVAPVASEQREGYSGSPYVEGCGESAGLSPESFWLTSESFLSCWIRVNGWRACWLDTPSPHPNGGDAGQFLAEHV